MTVSLPEMAALLTASVAILMIGSTHLRLNVWLFSLQTMLLSIVTMLYAGARNEPHLQLVAVATFGLKTIAVPCFLLWIIKRVDVQRDTGTLIPSALAMHLSIAFLAVAYLLGRQLPTPFPGDSGWPTATAAISLVFSGLIVMLTRRIALSQIVGFLILENGIFLFGITHTKGMPMFIELGIMLDVLAGVMIAGLLSFRIKKSFEHIDITMLSELRE